MSAFPVVLLPNGGDWSAGLVTAAVVIGSIVLGFRIGRAARRRGNATHGNSSVNALLAVVSFILAFTFGAAASRHLQRQQLVIDQANAISTADLRADLLPAGPAAEAHALLAEFLQNQLDVSRDRGLLEQRLARNGTLQDRLWDLGRAVLAEQPSAHGPALFLESLNPVFDLQLSRITFSVYLRLVPVVWFVVYMLTALAMLAVGYEAGLAGSSERVLVASLVLAFSTIVMVIADLDDPGSGLLAVNQRPLEEVQLTLRAPR